MEEQPHSLIELLRCSRKKWFCFQSFNSQSILGRFHLGFLHMRLRVPLLKIEMAMIQKTERGLLFCNSFLGQLLPQDTGCKCQGLSAGFQFRPPALTLAITQVFLADTAGLQRNTWQDSPSWFAKWEVKLLFGSFLPLFQPPNSFSGYSP